MDVLTVLTAVGVMGMIVAIGVFFSWKVPVSKDSKQVLVFIVLNIAVPFVILNGVFNSDVTDDLLRQVGIVFVLSIVLHSGFIFIALILGRLAGFNSTLAKQLSLLAAIGNTGFIGIPLAATIFGPIGGLLAAVFDAGLDFVMFSVGLFLLQSGRKFHVSQLKTLINLPLIAVVVGISSAFLGFQAPAALQQLSQLLAGLAAPMAMLYIGILMQQLIAKNGFGLYKQIWFPTILRLFVFPLLAMPIIALIPADNLVKNIVALSISMPTFMLASILYARYTDAEDKAVMTICFTTALCLVTIPFMAFVWSFY
ncbi:AEC family transporter [Paenalkalicoccus suaedae]|uniref:AEC family transporter n=1 Tax=Paenalkalicoccus suaedae TaxID=2592382 RepID=A0A859F9X7_9BACI|nr:AEC family transporter [Paenalkalicoccus suaedae]QKS69949.1 AEC family transporter [Paenalkalicoccus suaedae]